MTRRHIAAGALLGILAFALSAGGQAPQTDAEALRAIAAIVVEQGYALPTTPSTITSTTLPPTTSTSTTAVPTTAAPTTTTTVAPTTTTAAPTTTTTSPPSGLYGAGVSGASLAVPVGAVSVTPATIVSQINSQPAGTAFALQPGTYLLGDLPNKAGNRYYGPANNHGAVIFDGQATIEVAWRLQTNNVFANMTIRRYRGLDDAPGNSPFLANGANNVVIRNVEFKDNRLSGLRFGGSGWLVDYITSQQNGQYCIGGSGSNHTVDHSLLSQCGVDGLAFAPRFAASDRGISKINHSTGFTVRNSEIRRIDSGGNGLWLDGNNSAFLIEGNYVHDIQRHGIIVELGEGGTIRNNTLVNTAYGSQPQDYRDAAIFNNYGGAILIEGNTIDGARNGIILYQPNRSFPADHANSVCGTVVRNNTIKGIIGNAWTGQHIGVTYEGCNPNSTPSQVTWTNNTEVGSVNHWLNNDATPAQWAARGYS